MTLEEIKAAVNKGKKVFWSNSLYEVKKGVYPSGNEHWDIVCRSNGHSIGLTWTDEKTMNGKEDDFYIFDSSNSTK
jgi:hypothetical protein